LAKASNKPIKCHFCKQIIEGEPVEVNTGVKILLLKKHIWNVKIIIFKEKNF